MNRKGIAITTILFGILILFLFLLVSLLGILSINKNNLEKLVDSDGGNTGRKIATMYANKEYDSLEDLKDAASYDESLAKSGLYCFKNGGECKYLSQNNIVEPKDKIYYKKKYSVDSKTNIFEAKYTGYYYVDACGASGGIVNSSNGESYKAGKGACFNGYIKLSAGEALFVNVGGKGNVASASKNAVVYGGYNGGGNGFGQIKYPVSSGGGATDIRLATDYYDTEGDVIPNSSTDKLIKYDGPYFSASKGSYQIDIYGENLTKCDFKISNDFSIAKKVENDNHYTIYVYVSKDVSNLGIYTNQTIKTTTVEKCSITRETFSKTEDRILVLGGGGGSIYNSDSDYGIGGGGDLIGFSGIKIKNGTVGTGGIQTKNGSGGVAGNFLLGGSATSSALGAGGGGGYYGGGSSKNYAGGGGGSSFVSGYAGSNAIALTTKSYFTSTNRIATNQTIHFSNKYFINGKMTGDMWDGDGYVNISYYGIDEPIRTDNLKNVRYIRDCINGYFDKDSNLVDANQWLEIQAIKNGQNIAIGKAIVNPTSDAKSTTYKYDYIIDGSIDNGKYGQTKLGGNQCIYVDLGDVYSLDEIAVWHDYTNNRIYQDNVLSVSNDKTNWINFNFGNKNENSNGKRVTAWDNNLDISLDTGKKIVNVNYDFNINENFKKGKYIDTGYQVDWSYDFSIETVINISKLKQRYLIFSSYSNKDVNDLLVEINTSNKVRLYIGNSGSHKDVSSSKTIVKDDLNKDIKIIFKWDALLKQYSVIAEGTTNNIEIKGTYNVSGKSAYNLRVGTVDNKNTTTIDTNIKSFKITIPRIAGEELNCLPNVSKVGYSFNGWSDTFNGGNNVLSTMNVPDYDVTYYVRSLSQNKYVLTLDSNGGVFDNDELVGWSFDETMTQASKEVTYNEMYDELLTPSRSGKTFNSWYTAKSGGTKITSESIYEIDGDSTLYARWK